MSMVMGIGRRVMIAATTAMIAIALANIFPEKLSVAMTKSVRKKTRDRKFRIRDKDKQHHQREFEIFGE